ncbi:hypothetical protein HY492_02330 [Candidatus Woesearchaeota archaeon]|nr:hypothetical protein [Candidatus Woesearchaeota archaeon]
MNNRGISPLIATVLLIAFSVALGAVVMSYGEEYVEQQAEFVNHGTEVSGNVCDAVNVQLITIKGQQELCVNSVTVDVSLDNLGSNVDAVQARIAGTQDITVIPNILQSSLASGSSLKTTFAFDNIGTPLQVKLTPIIRTQDGSEFCTGKAIVVEDLRRC